MEFEIRKEWFSFCLTAPYSEEHRQKPADCLSKGNSNKSKKWTRKAKWHLSSGGKTRFLIRFFQIILIVLLPFFVWHIHGRWPSFHWRYRKTMWSIWPHCFLVTEESTFSRSLCMDFLPPSGGVFRLSFSGSSPGIPYRRSCGFQGALLDLAIKNRHTTTWTWPSLPGWPWFGFAM